MGWCWSKGWCCGGQERKCDERMREGEVAIGEEEIGEVGMGEAEIGEVGMGEKRRVG